MSTPTQRQRLSQNFLGIATDFKMTGGKWESVQIAEELGAKWALEKAAWEYRQKLEEEFKQIHRPY